MKTQIQQPGSPQPPSFALYDWEEVVRARTHRALGDIAAYHGLDWSPSEAELTNFRNWAKLTLHPQALLSLQQRGAEDAVEKGLRPLAPSEQTLLDALIQSNASLGQRQRSVSDAAMKAFADVLRLEGSGPAGTSLTAMVREKLVPMGVAERQAAKNGAWVRYTPTALCVELVDRVNTPDGAPFSAVDAIERLSRKATRRPGALPPPPWEQDAGSDAQPIT